MERSEFRLAGAFGAVGVFGVRIWGVVMMVMVMIMVVIVAVVMMVVILHL